MAFKLPIQTRGVIRVADTWADPEFELRGAAEKTGARSVLSIPMLREGQVIGAITVDRYEPEPFLDKQLSLLETFADQAVIAIENVRLFNALETRNRDMARTLEQQTATSEVLRVIAGSPTDVRPILNTVAERAALLCNASHSGVLLREGDMLRVMAGYAHDPDAEDIRDDVIPARRTSINGRSILEGRIVHVEDVVPLLDTEYPDTRETQSRLQFRTALAVPMIREANAIGTIFLWRREVQPFSKDEIAQLRSSP